MLQGYKMFGIQDGGMCVTSPTAHKTYNKYGESQDCKSDGKGGPWVNQVYRFPGRKGKFMFCDNRGQDRSYTELLSEIDCLRLLNPPSLPSPQEIFSLYSNYT